MRFNPMITAMIPLFAVLVAFSIFSFLFNASYFEIALLAGVIVAIVILKRS